MNVRIALVNQLAAACIEIMDEARAQVLASFNAQASPLVAAAGDEPPAHVPAPAGVFDMDGWAARATTVVGPALEALVEEAVAQAAAGAPFDLNTTLARKAVAEHVAGIEQWGEYLRQDVAEVIEAGIRDGLSVQNIARNLSDELSEMRALRIARTETIAASNAGTWVAYQSSPDVTGLEWLAAADERTRPSHIAAHGQQVPLGGLFLVGASYARYPGDPLLPSGERVNCRCTLVSVTAATADPLSVGLPAGMVAAGPTAGQARTLRFPAVPDAASSFATSGDHTGSAMIALYPAAPEALAHEAGDVPEDLHVTVAFLGKIAERPDGAIDAAAAALDSVAASVGGTIEARVAGAGVLGDEGAVVLFLEAEGIQTAYDEFWSIVDEAAYHPRYPSFVPHLTIGYGTDDTETGTLLGAALAHVGETVKLNRLCLVTADQPLKTIELTPGPAASQETTMDQTAFTLPADQITVDTAVTWTDPDGTQHSGVIVGVDNLEPGTPEGEDGSNEPQGTVTVAPDDDPENPVEVGVALLELAAGEAEDADEGDGEGSEAEVEAEGPKQLDSGPAVSGTDMAPVPGQPMRARGPLVVEGVMSGDYRTIAPGALGNRQLPLDLMVMFRNPDGGEAHAGAQIAGSIVDLFRPENRPNEVWGDVIYDDSPVGQEAYRLLCKKMLRGVSVDMCDMVAEFEPDPESLFGGVLTVTSARIMGATQCSFPAFEEAFLEIVGPEALAASGGAATGVEARMHSLYDGLGALVASGGSGNYPVKPPADWFELPDGRPISSFTLDDVHPVRVSPEGRVYGFAAGPTCHISWDHRQKCVTVPLSSCAYAEFRKGQVLTAEGTLVSTGPLVTDTVHPDLHMSASDAQSFYHHTGACAADIVPYDIPGVGIYVAGALRPSATDEQVRVLRGSDVSPDWRPVDGRPGIEAVAFLAVNNSGFKVPGALVAAAGGQVIVPGRGTRALIEHGEVVALVASGGVRRDPTDQLAARLDDLEEQFARLATTVDPIRRERIRARAAALISG